jgi:outer membrane protein TolC
MFSVFCLFNTFCVLAETPEHEDILHLNTTLTLHAVIEKSLPHYPSLHLLNAKTLELNAQLAHAQQFLPSVPSVQLRNQNDVLLSGRGETEWELSAAMPLWLTGQRQARQAIAMQAALLLKADSEITRLQLAGLVRDALWEISLMQAQASIAKSRQEAAKALQKDLETRVTLGDASVQDVLLVKAETLLAQSELVNAEAEIQHAKFRYTNLTGLSEMPAEFSEVRSNKTLENTHPLLTQANQYIAIKQAEVNLTQIEARSNPTLNIGVRSIRGAFDTQFNQSMGVSVSIPLQVESYASPQIARAMTAKTESEVALAQLHLTLKAAFHEAEHNLEIGEIQLNLLTQQLENATQNLNMASTAYKLGELELTAFLRSQTSRFQAEKHLKTQQMMQLWNTARYNQAVGELP